MAKTWVKFDDELPQNPKLRSVSDHARWTYISAICYSGHHLTDGFIPDSMLLLLDGTKRIATALVGAGLWEKVPGGWHIHDYEEYNRTRAQAAAASERNGKNGALGRASRDGPSSRDTSDSPDKRAGKSPADRSLSLPSEISSEADQGLPSSEIRESDGLRRASDSPAVSGVHPCLIRALGRWLEADDVLADCRQLCEEFTEDEVAAAIKVQRRTPDENGRFQHPFPRNLRPHLTAWQPAPEARRAEQDEVRRRHEREAEAARWKAARERCEAAGLDPNVADLEQFLPAPEPTQDR